MAGSGRRFALEAAFLVLLAVGAGLAGLSAGQIIGVMALGWVLTALVELASWLLAVRHPAPAVPRTEPPALAEARAAPAVQEEAVVAPEPPEAAKPGELVEHPVVAEVLGDAEPLGFEKPPAADEQRAWPAEPGAAREPEPEREPEREPEPEPQPEPPAAVHPAADEEQVLETEPEEPVVEDHEPARTYLEPLQPRLKRRPFWRRRREVEEEEEEEVDVQSLERPSAHHVRLLPRPAQDADEADTDEDALGGPAGRVDAEQR